MNRFTVAQWKTAMRLVYFIFLGVLLIFLKLEWWLPLLLLGIFMGLAIIIYLWRVLFGE